MARVSKAYRRKVAARKVAARKAKQTWRRNRRDHFRQNACGSPECKHFGKVLKSKVFAQRDERKRRSSHRKLDKIEESFHPKGWQRERNSYIMEDIRNGLSNKKIRKELTFYGFQVNRQVRTNGPTILWVAVDALRTTLVKWLLQLGADPNQNCEFDGYSEPPLEYLLNNHPLDDPRVINIFRMLRKASAKKGVFISNEIVEAASAAAAKKAAWHAEKMKRIYGM